MFEARGVTVRRNGRAILDAASLRVEPGCVTAICGPNGAGKSTLLAVLSGAMRPDDGAALLDGEDVHTMPPAALARRRAVMEQSAEAALGFLAREVVAFGLDAAPERPPAEADALVRQAMAETDTATLADAPMVTLSGGEAQRVHLARALVQLDAPAHGGTRTLMLDEPTASLDLRHQGTALGAARRRAGDGAAVLAVLHDLALAAAFADRVVLMSEGCILAIGPPDTVLSPTRLEAAYGIAVHVVPTAHGPSFHPQYRTEQENIPCTSP